MFKPKLHTTKLFIIFQSTSSLESNLEGLASVLEADLTTYKAKILKILSECALKLPDKCTIYTTLIGLLNTKNYNFGGEVSSGIIIMFGFGPELELRFQLIILFNILIP